MPFICIVPGCDNKQKVYSVVMFHRFPTHPKRRKKWFDALKMDPTNLEGLKNWRVCSEHFTEEDYTSSGLRLKNSATPTILRSRIQQRRSSSNAANDTFLESVPHSTSQKQKADEPTATFKVPLAVQLASPSPTKPAVLLTAFDPADISFVPDSSTSTSTTGSSSSLSGQPRGFKERKWIVNESKLLELFLICPKCGSAMCDLNQTITQFGSRIYINWQCNNGHMGQWESCPNVRGMAEITSLQQLPLSLLEMQRYTSIKTPLK
uniref:THAP domain-containing protein 1 n=1 Tax=Neogobius melanostomus TaxID=47308 RepID=A0A8C6U2Q0_9GOBI